MDLKKKLSETKTKIKENRSTIITVISTGIAIVSTVAYVVTDKKLKIAREGNREILHKNLNVGVETLFLSAETEKEIVEGSKDVYFDVNGMRFDVILHPED